MTTKILLVDDDPNILAGYRRLLRGKFEIDISESGKEALIAIEENGPYAVVVSDMRMPVMDGIELLQNIRNIAPETVSIMLTGNADQQTAIDAINQGHIFRFLTKPCNTKVMTRALKASLEQYRLITAEKELLEKTLKAAVNLLTEILSLVKPVAFGRAQRVRRLVRHLCKELKPRKTWQIELAAMLSQIGCVTVPDDTLEKVFKNEELSAQDSAIFHKHYDFGKELILKIPRLEEVAVIVACQENNYSKTIPMGARILKVALDFDSFTSSGLDSTTAFAKIRKNTQNYDPEVVEALKKVQADSIKFDTRYIGADSLELGMIIAQDVSSLNGTLLIGRGQEVTNSLMARLINFKKNEGVREPIKIVIPLGIAP
jgi:response regulator RpfG family c-di-GMP phosphodiesterase